MQIKYTRLNSGDYYIVVGNGGQRNTARVSADDFNEKIKELKEKYPEYKVVEISKMEM